MTKIYFDKMDCYMDSIHFLSRLNNLKLGKEEMEEADNFIKKYILDNNLLDNIPLKAFSINSPIKVSDKDITPVIVRYYAYTQNTLDFAKKLEEVNYSFHEKPYLYQFYSLNKDYVESFSEDEYISLLLNHNNVIKSFDDSLIHTKGEERLNYIREFARILKKNDNIFYIVDNDKKKCLNHLLTKRNIDVFGSDFLLKATDSQKRFINYLKFKLDDSLEYKAKEYLNKYPDVIPNFEMTPEVLRVFSIDELATISKKDAKLYTIALREGIVDRLRSILDMDPSFTCPDQFLNRDVFDTLDDETILNLTPQGKTDISLLKAMEVGHNIIIPPGRINRCVFKDNRRKREYEAPSKSR